MPPPPPPLPPGPNAVSVGNDAAIYTVYLSPVTQPQALILCSGQYASPTSTTFLSPYSTQFQITQVTALCTGINCWVSSNTPGICFMLTAAPYGQSSGTLVSVPCTNGGSFVCRTPGRAGGATASGLRVIGPA